MVSAISSDFCPTLAVRSVIRAITDCMSWIDFWSAVDRSTLLTMPFKLLMKEVTTGPGSTNEILKTMHAEDLRSRIEAIEQYFNAL